MGSGKTTVANLLHPKLKDTAFLSLATIKRFITGFEKNHSYNVLSQEIIMLMTEKYLKNNINVMAEWAMSNKRVEAFKKLAKKHKIQIFIYQLHAPRELLVGRVTHRTKDLLTKLTNKNIKNINENFDKNYNFRIENSYTDAKVLDSKKFTPTKLVNLILKDIKN